MTLPRVAVCGISLEASTFSPALRAEWIGVLELFDLAADWMLALTPGGVDQDLARLGHTRIQRPMFPLDDVSSVDPTAHAVLFPGDTAR